MPVTPILHRSSTTVAADGTPLEYLTVGEPGAPGLIVVHGAMQSALSQRDLAGALAGDFAVHLINRRGRGGSGPYPPAPVTPTDVADVQAVMAATDARAVLGVSSGALIAARVALAAATRPSATIVDKLVLFEPPLVVGDSVPMAFAERVSAELDAGDLPGALVTSMLGTEMGPGFLRFVPRRLLRMMTTKMLAGDDAKDLADGGVHVRIVAEALRHDLAVVTENADSAGEFAAILAKVLILNGDRTRPYLLTACDELARVLPDATRVVLPGLGHSATGNRDERGAPDTVARVVADFLRARSRRAHGSAGVG